MKKTSRRFQEAKKQIENKLYNYIDGIQLLKNIASTKFIETAEAHIMLGLDPKYADQQLRATVTLPKGTGKTIRIAVITKESKMVEAAQASADIIGSEDLIEEINKGRMDFDKLIATPDVMPLIAKLGKVLGPRGLMPSPKAGTVTNELNSTIKQFKQGKIEYRVDKTGIVHLPFGKTNFSTEDLAENLLGIYKSIDKNKPAGAKGKYWKTFYICSTMGPSINIDISSMHNIVQSS